MFLFFGTNEKWKKINKKRNKKEKGKKAQGRIKDKNKPRNV